MKPIPLTKNTAKHKITRIKTYPVEFIFNYIRNNMSADYYVDEDGNRCKLRRAKIFFEIGLSCVEKDCNLTASFFALEQWPMGDFHFDLYAMNAKGEDVLMTIDHVHPKSKGGKDINSNYQPMCNVHNTIKRDNV